MKTFLTTTAVALGLTAGAAGAVSINVSPGSFDPVANNFSSDLSTLFGGSYSFATLDSVNIDANTMFSFWAIAANSSYNNTLTITADSVTTRAPDFSTLSTTKNGPPATVATVTETWGTQNFFSRIGDTTDAPDITATYTNAGKLLGETWEFTSNIGVQDRGLGDERFGVFYSAGSDFMVLGFDDQDNNPDDNHEDILVYVTAKVGGDEQTIDVVPVPASALLLGGALAGLGFARRRKAKKS